MEPTDVEIDKIRKKLELGLDAVEARKVVAEAAPTGEASDETAPGARQTPAGESEPGEDVAALASPEQHDARRYTIEPGDTLWGIALRFLGSGTRYDLLFEANRDRVGEGYLIWPGDELVIPEGP
jgi:nucleoid-associated protein YgaU